MSTDRAVVVFLSLFLLYFCSSSASDTTGFELLDNQCTTCQNIVRRFNEGLSKTAKANFGGGNTHWEEKKLGSYAVSETRFLEIIEHLCPDSGKESKDCHHMVEAKEDVLEQWWFQQYAKRLDTNLHQYLCVDNIQSCCPNGTYGPQCKDCNGGREKPCGGRGKCIGDGTRNGSGGCACNVGYKNEMCDACDDGYYKTDGDAMACSKCHMSCKSLCNGPGQQGCVDCNEGWTMLNGCQDDNECEDSPCDEDEFCTNTDGSYRCTKCNRACSSCSGSTSNHCVECASKHYKDGDTCRPCHESCSGSCSDSTPSSCDACTTGWTLRDKQCENINECTDESTTCKDDEYCVDTVGSYKCSTCHSSCAQCSGPGSDGCVTCKTGFTRSADNRCVDVDECALASTVELTTIEEQKELCQVPHMNCINVPGSYRCDCDPGYIKKDDFCIARPKDFRSDDKKSTVESTKSKTAAEKKSKKSKKKDEKKVARTHVFDMLSYGAVLVSFVITMWLLKVRFVVQCVVAVLFWMYMYWFIERVERASLKHK